MKNDRELVGTFRGFDGYVNMVLEDVTEFESTPEGRRINKLDQIFLNGNHVTMLVPGGDGPDMNWKDRIKVQIAYFLNESVQLYLFLGI